MKFGIGNRKNNGVGGRQQEEATGVRKENKAKGKSKKAKVRRRSLHFCLHFFLLPFAFLLRLFLRRAELFQQRAGPEIPLESVTDDLVIDLPDLQDMFGPDEVASERCWVKPEHFGDDASQFSVYGEPLAAAARNATRGSFRR